MTDHQSKLPPSEVSAAYRVSRGSFGNNPDVLMVEGDHGELCAFATMQPGGLLSPVSADEARSRPWFFTGSPFGAHLIGLAWERHAERQRMTVQ